CSSWAVGGGCGSWGVVGCFFFFQAEDGIRDWSVTGVQTCALPICGVVQLGSVGRFARALGPNTIERFGRQRQVVISANLQGKDRSEERRVGKECRARGGGDG